jgi:hypothetical protein
MGRSLYPAGVLLALASSATPAHAAAFDDGYGQDPTKPLNYAFDGIAAPPAHDRKFDMGVGFRVRGVSVPRSVLDIWYYDKDDPDWAYIKERPRLLGHAIGLEYWLRGNAANGIFYTEFIDSHMPDGYWDDIEEPPDHLDGDYLSPSRGMGLVAFGADYAYEAHIVKNEMTDDRFALSFLVGGGLGLGALVGRLDRWGPDDNGNPSYKRYLDGLPPDDDKQVPRVYPMVDVNTGLSFDFGDRVNWRLEGGLHTLLYYGTSIGVSF